MNGTSIRGRMATVRPGNAKLDEEGVRLIRKLAAEKIATREIAERLGVSSACVREVVRGARWGHVEN